ncbi:hypothetical protein L4C34_16695 [Vibrio profundum]|uniref:hypothetical protein n=1 Tax=Vibrio profundum TaxID=2910247 RepID=UPI003D0D3CF8
MDKPAKSSNGPTDVNVSDDKLMHGRYVLEFPSDFPNIMILRFYDEWNTQTAVSCIEECHRRALEHFKGRSWGVMADLQQWGLCTPETINYMRTHMFNFITIGLKMQAVLPSGILNKMVAETMHNEVQPSNFISEYFSNQEEALAWLDKELQRYEGSN